MAFGERLLLVRKKKGLSQAEVGKLIRINGDDYGRYERNEVRPTIEMATKIAEVLGVSLDYLAGKTDLELENAMIAVWKKLPNFRTRKSLHLCYPGWNDRRL